MMKWTIKEKCLIFIDSRNMIIKDKKMEGINYE